MKTIQILESNDIVLPDDYCRPTNLFIGLGEVPHMESMSGTPMNNLKWVKAKYIFSLEFFTLNSTVSQFNNDYTDYEFVRGDLPDTNLYGKTNSELSEEYDNYLKSHIMSFGKYKGKSLDYIKNNYREYFLWLIGNINNIIPEEFLPIFDRYREY